VRECAHGFKTIAEPIYLRERILRQLQLAASAGLRVDACTPPAAGTTATVS
jgi:hypothetical protein